MASKKTKQEVPATEVRPGKKGTPVLVVLVCSLAFAAIVWVLLELWGSSIAPNEPDKTVSSGSNETLNPGAPKPESFDDNPPAGSKPASEGTDRNPVR